MFSLRRSRGSGACRTVRREVGGVCVQVNDDRAWHILRKGEHFLAGYVILCFPAGGVLHQHHLFGPRLHDDDGALLEVRQGVHVSFARELVLRDVVCFLTQGGGWWCMGTTAAALRGGFGRTLSSVMPSAHSASGSCARFSFMALSTSSRSSAASASASLRYG